MTIIGNEPETAKPVEEAKTHEKPNSEPAEREGGKWMFSDSNLPKNSEVAVGKEKDEVSLRPKAKTVTITPDEKVAFIDSVVNNTRFEKEYSLFGGKITFTVRSITVDEMNALASWTASKGSSDPAGLMAGRYRKYLAAAQIARYNGVDMPPLDEPLFPTLGKDGKTVNDPGWIKRCDYWDVIGAGVFTAIMACLSDFDMRYSTLCREAENANFWIPDTP